MTHWAVFFAGLVLGVVSGIGGGLYYLSCLLPAQRKKSK